MAEYKKILNDVKRDSLKIIDGLELAIKVSEIDPKTGISTLRTQLEKNTY